MGAPQIIVIVLLSMDVVVNIAKHGEPKSPYNALIGVLDSVIIAALLWWGGFWN